MSRDLAVTEAPLQRTMPNAATCSHSRHRDDEGLDSIPKPRKNEDCKDLPLARRAFPVRLRVLALDEQIAVYTRRGDRAFVVDDLQRSTPAANKPHHELEPPARTVRLPSWRRRTKRFYRHSPAGSASLSLRSLCVVGTSRGKSAARLRKPRAAASPRSPTLSLLMP